MIENKSINNQSYILGQYMTPTKLVDSLIEELNYDENCVYIEPSFGTSNFVRALKNKGIPLSSIVGCELDPNLYNTSTDLEFEKHNVNFYDWKFSTNKKIVFVGNPPFRTPAMSLKSHPVFIKKLCKKYNVKGIREEAVFFILRCLEIIESNGNGGEIKFILPKTIFTNNSKFFLGFQSLINQKFNIKSVIDIPDGSFDSASLQMVYISLEYEEKKNEEKIGLKEDYWDYTQIFKKTYLGSVPCESIFLSCKDETISEFRDRLLRLYSSELKNLNNNLRHKGNAHLKVLNGKNDELKEKKLQVIWDYLVEIRTKISDSFVVELNNIDNYKIINHRNEFRYYFRNSLLKKMSFVYEINPNPQRSFYFTGNPSKSSTDYFGYCEYDITRNSSPGACRTIPIKNIEDNLTSDFKNWWDDNNLGEYSQIFEMFIKTSKSRWYKNMKKKYNRFYFGIPKELNNLL